MRLHVAESSNQDVGRGIVRVDLATIRALELQIGDAVFINSADKHNRTVAKALPLPPEKRNQSIVQMDGTLRHNAGVRLGDDVTLTAVDCVENAGTMTLEALGHADANRQQVLQELQSMIVLRGDSVRVDRMSGKPRYYRVIDTQSEAPIIITPETQLKFKLPEKVQETTSNEASLFSSYEDIGGLDDEIQKIREMVELPMRFPQVFQHLGITPPRGILLHGPPGSGKTLIARTLANESNANFYVINGPEIIDKFYGQSEGALREIFQEANQNTPAILFIDEIDAIAPRRDRVQGEVEKRVVAQLLTLMDGLEERGDVVVIGATNLPDSVDPALRRPGRFDREVGLRVPTQAGRYAILQVHTRGMPLADDVDLGEIAQMTHGYVGADIQALCREAAMRALRRYLADDSGVALAQLYNLSVQQGDFEFAFAEMTPSTTRQVAITVPDVSWDDIGGLAREKDLLRQALEFPQRYPEQFAQAKLRPPRGVLLSGPPGTGKTLLAKAAANAINVNFISVRGPELLNKWVGESERAVRELFATARMAAPCLIFFDEFDALAPVRKGTDPVAERLVAQLLAEMDGIEEHTDVTILAATNRPGLIDPAVLRPGRLDVHLIVDLPDDETRRAILEIHLAERPVHKALNYEALVEATKGWSGAQITEACRRAAQEAVLRAIETDTPVEILPDDFEEAIR